MDNQVSVWKATLNTGVILGLLGIVWTLFLWFIDQSLNNTLGAVFFMFQLARGFFVDTGFIILHFAFLAD